MLLRIEIMHGESELYYVRMLRKVSCTTRTYSVDFSRSKHHILSLFVWIRPCNNLIYWFLVTVRAPLSLHVSYLASGLINFIVSFYTLRKVVILLFWWLIVFCHDCCCTTNPTIEKFWAVVERALLLQSYENTRKTTEDVKNSSNNNLYFQWPP